MSMKLYERRSQAIARCTRGDLNLYTPDEERRIAEAEWRRRSRAARHEREVRTAALDERIVDSGLELQDQLARELHVIKFPRGLEDLVADLEEDTEIAGLAFLLLETESPLLGELVAA